MTDTTKLSEFAAEFLGDEIQTVISSGYKGKTAFAFAINVNTLIYDPVYAPILAHIAKREMEKRGFWWKFCGGEGCGEYDGFFAKKHISDIDEEKVSSYHENEYKALWMAIENAVK